jgi:uncharacterized protein (UPF0147 family)
MSTEKNKSKRLQEATEILNKLTNYYAIAKNINENEMSNTERTLSLENISYGEEEIRAEEAISKLEQAISDLQSTDNSDEQSSKLEDAIYNAESTYDDLTSLPPEESEEE